jgi:hypothetical protein
MQEVKNAEGPSISASTREGLQWLRDIFFASLTVVCLLDWAHFLYNLANHWREIPSAHHSSILFAICYPMPWLFLLPRWRERAWESMLIVLFTYVAFAAAVQMRFP